jgi:Phosphoinositide phospholipase C, Ca2+-dependent
MRRTPFLVMLVLVASSVLAAACDGGGGGAPEAYPLDDSLRVDEIQLLTTHNSYHQRAPIPLPGALGDTLDYEHPPLDEQLEDQGIRGFELDVATNGDEFPVVHTPVVDASSNCDPFVDCLRVIKDWSDAHPGHAPIFVLVETKDGLLERGLDPRLREFDADALAGLDEEIRSVFRPSQLLTPDDVRGNARTLRAAVRERGWPTMSRARGKVAFVLNSGGAKRDLYLAGRPSLQGAPMFVTAEPDAPSAAVIKVDDPDEALIKQLVRDHYVVRTRADADVVEARTNDVARRDLALRSGAQLVSTDFPVPDPSINADYQVQLPGGKPARCNPVQAPADCRAVDVENPKYLTKL